MRYGLQKAILPVSDFPVFGPLVKKIEHNGLTDWQLEN